jgi:hypothetical protein
MPKKIRKMKGGFLDNLTQDINSMWDRTKNATRNAYYYVTGEYNPNYYSGGRNKTRRHLRGGYTGNTNLALNSAPIKNMKGGYGANRDISATAAPIHNIKTTQVQELGGGYAQPEWLAKGGNSFIPQPSLIGGKTKRNRHSKSRKSKK